MFFPQCLINKIIDRQAPLKDDISREVYENSDIKPFKIESGACLEALSVVPLLHRYCAMLPNDNFTVSTITWTARALSEVQHEISVVMPTQSTIKETITVSFFFYYYRTNLIFLVSIQYFEPQCPFKPL